MHHCNIAILQYCNDWRLYLFIPNHSVLVE